MTGVAKTSETVRACFGAPYACAWTPAFLRRSTACGYSAYTKESALTKC